MGTFNFFLVLIVLVAFLLILVIMVQNPKGGGLSSSFGGGGGQQLGGVQKTTDFLDKTTWGLWIALILLILSSNYAINNSEESGSIAVDTDPKVDTSIMESSNDSDDEDDLSATTTPLNEN